MSQQNVEIAARIYEATGVVSDATLEKWSDLFDPAVEFDMSRRLIDPGVYRGAGEIVRWVDEGRAVYGSLEVVPEELLDAGEKVVAMVRMRARGTLSGAPVEALIAHVLTLRDGKLLRLEYYGDREEALRAAGLAE
jgi:ketosteroid isomerase-like protein